MSVLPSSRIETHSPGTVIQFKVVTEADKKDVDEVHKKLVGPREDGKKSYTDELLGQLATLQRTLQEKIKKMKEQQDKEETRKKVMGASRPTPHLLDTDTPLLM